MYVKSVPLPVAGVYVCLSGQHTMCALQTLQTEHLSTHTTAPPWLTTIVADIIKPATPLPRRRSAAGAYQHRQHQMADVQVSRILYWVAQQHHRPGTAALERARTALEYTGAPRNVDAVCPAAHCVLVEGNDDLRFPMHAMINTPSVYKAPVHTGLKESFTPFLQLSPCPAQPKLSDTWSYLVSWVDTLGADFLNVVRGWEASKKLDPSQLRPLRPLLEP